MQLVANIATPGATGVVLKGDLFDCSMHWHPDERDAVCDWEEQAEISERLTGDCGPRCQSATAGSAHGRRHL
jgi:hypothetical protein